jgi:hypothetical protein
MNAVKPTGCNPWAWIDLYIVPTPERGNKENIHIQPTIISYYADLFHAHQPQLAVANLGLHVAGEDLL